MIPMAQPRPRAGTQALFRFRPVRDKVLVTNLEGRWLLLSQEDFQAYARGEVSSYFPIYQVNPL